MDFFFRVFASFADFIGMAIFYLLAIFVFILTFTLNLVMAKKKTKEQRRRINDLYPRTLNKDEPSSRLPE